MFGYIKGYDVTTVTKRKLKKEKFLSEINKVDKNVEKELNEVIENKGYAIGLKKKKILKVVYIFKKVDKTLVFEKSIKTSDVVDETIKQFEGIIEELLKEKIAFGEISKVKFLDKEITPNDSGISMSIFSTFLSLGIVYGLLFDNLMLGLCFGASIGLCFAAGCKRKK